MSQQEPRNGNSSGPRNEPKSPNGEGEQRSGGMLRPGPNLWLLGALLLAALLTLYVNQDPEEISEDFFISQLKGNNVARVTYIGSHEVLGLFRDPPEKPAAVNEKGELTKPTKRNGEPIMLDRAFRVTLDPQMSEQQKQELQTYYDDGKVEKRHQFRKDNSAMLMLLFSILIPVALLLILWNMFRRTRDQIMGGGFLSGFSKSTAKRFEEGEQTTTFDDVAGLEGVKTDLQELVEFLKDPEKFQRLGARVPKGVLLNGPPGTGKTLLARAVAGEAKVPFYSVNGSEFIQMFVGVGASRVR
ncbi:MAG: ATP-dependent metallopeptidase FtsH/Yme1/Tma family protein, partial [Planctomycetota bacterium]